ncbi:Hsp20/alpha crystallin family protein [Thalassobaculum sp.]|uniref:Hsp20/alpha crystallin family protein n=1 Tax=Thalassobaculum sp. TaxID=2022740 RepID=UPI0032EF7C24
MAEQDKASVPASTSARAVDPFSAFRSEMDRVIDGFFGGRSPFGMPSFGMPDLRVGEVALVPQVDVREDDNAISVTAELPGLTEKDVEVTLEDGVLTLKGEKREEKTDADAKLTERRYGRFMRSFRLPDGIDEDKVTASVDHGVLHISVPKNPNAAPKARRVPIGGKS